MAQQAGSWWVGPLSECAAALHVGTDGLSGAAAAAKMSEVGPNLLRKPPKGILLRSFLGRLKNPLVIILLTASAISGFTGAFTSCIIITVIVLMSATLDVFQEYRADQAAARLKESVAVRAKVVRDGAPREILVAEVVPGDVVLLCAGDLVPADGRVIEARDLFVKQALLTGEPYPVEKHAQEVGAEAADLQSATNALFMGTSIVSGAGRMLVVKTGTATVVGGIADSLNKPPPPTSFEIGTRHFGMLVMQVTILMVLFVLLVNTYFHRPLLESFLFAVALAVGLTPELLPMIVTVTLARGAMHMAEKRVIVKRLAAIQNLGSMDVLCTDKTGTLTEAKIALARHIDAAGRDSERVLELAYLNSFFETGLKSPLDDAILDAGRNQVDAATWSKIDEVPFDFERRRVSVLIAKGPARLLIAKGAPEDLAGLCTRYELDGPDHLAPLDDAALIRIRAQYAALGRDGLRVLGIAWREVPADHPHAVVTDESELTFGGFAAFMDPPKQSAGAALAALEKIGVAVKIVTGDSELVTQHICSELNIAVTGVITGSELAQMDDSALRARVETANLFCRVNPAQKDRVILAFRARGHVVGYLGDGINDAPSLHSADVGLSVDSAVDVAREAADVILLEPDLQVLCEGVVEGRRTFGNILKYIMMGTSSNFGNMFSMAGASLFLPFLPMLPTQILLNNMLYDVSEIPIPLDKVDDIDLVQPRMWDMRFIRNFMLVVGPVSSLFDFLTFYVMLVVLKASEPLFQTGWFIESLATQVLVIFIIRTRGNPFRSRPHPLLVATSLAVVGAAVLLPFTGLGAYFGFTPPPARFFVILSMMLVAYLIVVEVVKNGFYRWMVRSTPPRPAAT